MPACPTLIALPTVLRAVIVMLSLLLLPSPAPAQEATPSTATAARQGAERPLLPTAQLKTFFFTPEHGDPGELLDLVEQMHGRLLWIVERGGFDASPVANMQLLGSTIVIYDTEAMAQLIGETLHGLDAQVAAMEEHDEQEQGAWKVVEWAPSYISLQTAWSLLEPFGPDLSISEERRLLVLMDEAERVEAMLEVLRRIDQPEPQLLVSALVLHGVPEEDLEFLPASHRAPPDLEQHLGTLVPYQHFAVVSQGLVRTSALARQVELRLGEGYALQLSPDAYDGGTRSLTARCQFAGPGGVAFETRTTLAGGEHVVLGATGSQPLFVVLRITPLD